MNWRAFVRKQARRLRVVALPAALGACLSVFAITQLPSANTLWTQQLSLSASVSTGTWECKPYTLTANVTTTAGNTTYTYMLTGGGFVPQGDDCKYAVSTLALDNVCFSPLLSTLGGAVLAETHPPATTNPASSWTYNPANSATKRVKWDATNVGAGPFNLQFSITLAGLVSPVNGQFTLHAGRDYNTGSIAVPDPASCHVPAARIANAAPPASVTPTAGADDSTPTANADAPTPTPQPPTPTPTPKARQAGPTPTPVGIAVYPR